MTPNFHLLAPAGEVLISAYVGSSSYIFDVPALADALGSGPARRMKFCYSVTKGSAIDSGTDYVRLETSPDGGTTWFGMLGNYDDAAAANFLEGKSGTSAAFELPIELFAGQKVRMTASAGLTLVRCGFSH